MTQRTFKQDGFTVRVYRLLDEDPDLSYLEQECFEPEGKERLAAFHRGDWYMMGIRVDIQKQTSTNRADGGPIVGSASLWGIELESDEAYLASVEQELNCRGIRGSRSAEGCTLRMMHSHEWVCILWNNAAEPIGWLCRVCNMHAQTDPNTNMEERNQQHDQSRQTSFTFDLRHAPRA